MNTATSAPLSFSMLFDPTEVLAAADRASKWNLPRRICRPLDRRTSTPVNADVAAYDAEVDETTAIEDDCTQSASEV